MPQHHATHRNAGIAALGPINTKAEIHSFQEAEVFLGPLSAVPAGSVKEVARNVYVVRESEDTIAIRLYNTIVIRYHRDNTFEVDNGGYNTLTTKNRINQFGPKGWFFWHHNKVLHGCHSETMDQDLKMYKYGEPMHFGEKWSIHGVLYYAVCETYNVRETLGEEFPHISADAYEYNATLFDYKGNEVDTFDSFPEEYSGSGQTLTEEQAQTACNEITADVQAGHADKWFHGAIITEGGHA